MTFAIFKIILASVIIAFSSWLAGKKPGLAGFIIALPISSMIAIALNYGEFKDAGKSAEFARSILIALPLSTLFFVPFFFIDRLKLPFAAIYASGVLLLSAGYLVHRYLAR